MRGISDLAVLGELPPGFGTEETAEGVLAVRADLAEPLRATGYGPASDGALGSSDLAGRRPLLELAIDGRPHVVRRFSHGGLLRWLTRDRYLDPERPFRELILSSALRGAGVRTPEVVAARARARRGPGWTLDVITPRVPDAIDLGRVLELARRGAVEPAVRRRLAAAAGRLVGELHALGLLHADLHPRNVLVERAALDGAPARPWILDLDGSRLSPPPLAVDARRRNLRRLYRYVDRRDAREGSSLSTAERARFLAAYAAAAEGRGADGAPGEGGWRAHWRAVARAHRRTRPVHAAGWILERGLGSASDDALAEAGPTDARRPE
jgi:3-deoxy-D-manno-octulosonic acid kinase